MGGGGESKIQGEEKSVPDLFQYFWDRLSRVRNFISLHGPLAPLLNNPAFTQGLTPTNFQWRTNKCFLRIADLCDRCILTKQFLQNNHQQLAIEHSCYTQIQCVFQTLLHYSDVTTMSAMEYLCKKIIKIPGHISAI